MVGGRRCGGKLDKSNGNNRHGGGLLFYLEGGGAGVATLKVCDRCRIVACAWCVASKKGLS